MPISGWSSLFHTGGTNSKFPMPSQERWTCLIQSKTQNQTLTAHLATCKSNSGGWQIPQPPPPAPSNALPRWPAPLSVLTTLGACFIAVTDTDAAVRQLGFGSHTAPERYTWRGHCTPPTLYALIHKRQLTSTCCTPKVAMRMKCDNDCR